MISRVSAYAILLLLLQPAFAQTQTQPPPLSSQAPVNQSVGPMLLTPPAIADQRQARQSDAARREADTASINQGMNEARERADQQMDAANTALVTGVISGANQVASGAVVQSPGSQSQDIEALAQHTMAQSARDSESDLRDIASEVRRQNEQRQRAREYIECLRNASDASQCPCPSGTQRVNGQCLAEGN